MLRFVFEDITFTDVGLMKICIVLSVEWHLVTSKSILRD